MFTTESDVTAGFDVPGHMWERLLGNMGDDCSFEFCSVVERVLICPCSAHRADRCSNTRSVWGHGRGHVYGHLRSRPARVCVPCFDGVRRLCRSRSAF